jgi:hypothetical protein
MKFLMERTKSQGNESWKEGTAEKDNALLKMVTVLRYGRKEEMDHVETEHNGK